MYDLLPNTPLAERIQQHLESVGIPTYTETEMSFATDLQTSVGFDPIGMADAVLPLPNEPALGGRTDVGDVSWITPTMGLSVASIPQRIGVHTWMATASHGTSIGEKAAVATNRNQEPANLESDCYKHGVNGARACAGFRT